MKVCGRRQVAQVAAKLGDGDGSTPLSFTVKTSLIQRDKVAVTSAKTEEGVAVCARIQ